MERKVLYKPDWVTDLDKLPLVGGVFQENGTGEEWERISPYKMRVSENGPNFAVDVSTELGVLEYRALMRIRDLAIRGYKYIVWLSPAGGKSDYTDSRMVVAIVHDTTDEEIEFNCRGIVLKTDGQDLLKPAGMLLVDGGESVDDINTVEDLRTNPIGFNLKRGIDWTAYLQMFFGRDNVWREIRSGGDVRRQKRIETELVDVYRRITTGVSNFNVIGLGTMIEAEMARRGFAVAGGNHGSTYSEISGRSVFTTSFNTLFAYSAGTINVIESNGKRVCPCGCVLTEGCKTCPKCGVKFE